MHLGQDIRAGNYARKQLLSPLGLIAWSHRNRYELGLKVARQFGGERILDYGCGDGTFLALLTESTPAPAVAVGAEIDSSVVDDCRRRLASRPALRFVLTSELAFSEHQGAYTGLVCMEVLEHVVEVEHLMASFHQLLEPGGTLVISAPVETGLPVLLKQAVRRVAGWLHIDDYPGITPYSWRELLKAVFAGSTPHIDRPIYSTGGVDFHDHKGFNWKVLHGLIERHFKIEQILASPVRALPPSFGSQVWFIARKHSSEHGASESSP